MGTSTGDYQKFDTLRLAVATTSGVAYAAGDVIGNKYALADFDPLQPEGFKITGARLFDLDGNAANVDLYFWAQSPSAGTFQDNSALAIAATAAEAYKSVGVVHITDHCGLGGAGLSQTNADLAVRLRSAGDQLYVVPVARAARTHTSVAGLLLSLNIEQA